MSGGEIARGQKGSRSDCRVFVSGFARIHLEKLRSECVCTDQSASSDVKEAGTAARVRQARSPLAPIGSLALFALGVKELFLCHSGKKILHIYIKIYVIFVHFFLVIGVLCDTGMIFCPFFY